MDKKVIIVICLLIMSFLLHSELTQGELFRDKEHKYRIRFPFGWEIVEGDGAHIKKKATNENGSTVYVLSMFTDAEELEEKNLKKESKILLEGLKKEIRQRFHNVRFLDEGIRFLSNKQFLYLKYIHTKRELDYEIDEIRLAYTIINDNIIYVIGGGSYETFFNEDEFEIIESIRSFIIEDFDKNISYKEYKALKSSQPPKKKYWKLLLYPLIFLIIIIIARFIVEYRRKDSDTINNITLTDTQRKKPWINFIFSLIVCLFAGIGNSAIYNNSSDFGIFLAYALGGFIGCLALGILISSIICFVKFLITNKWSHFSIILLYVCLFIAITSIYSNYSFNL